MDAAGDDEQRQQQHNERHIIEQHLVLQVVCHAAHNQADSNRDAQKQRYNEFVDV